MTTLVLVEANGLINCSEEEFKLITKVTRCQDIYCSNKDKGFRALTRRGDRAISKIVFFSAEAPDCPLLLKVGLDFYYNNIFRHRECSFYPVTLPNGYSGWRSVITDGGEEVLTAAVESSHDHRDVFDIESQILWDYVNEDDKLLIDNDQDYVDPDQFYPDQFYAEIMEK